MSFAIFLFAVFQVISGKEKSRIRAVSQSVERSWCPTSGRQLTTETSENYRWVFLSLHSPVLLSSNTCLTPMPQTDVFV